MYAVLLGYPKVMVELGINWG